MATLICPHCGMANRAGANFCNNCGTDLRAEEAPLPGNIEPAAETAESRQSAAPEIDSGTVDPGIGDDQKIEAAEIEVTVARDRAVQDKSESARDSNVRDDSVQDNEELLVEQPWLQSEDDAPSTPVDNSSSARASRRTVAGLQGLLPPLDLGSRPRRRLPAKANDPTVVGDPLSPDQAEEVGYLMGETPAPMAEGVLLSTPRHRSSLRIPWLFWLLGLAVAVPILLLLGDPTGAPRQWPGVDEAYNTVAALPADAPVLAFWAYDPATAGEMDLLAVPVLRHLIDQRAELAVVSLLPGGPASARRALATALYGSPDDALLETTERLDLADEWLTANHFLPGGVAGLPLVAQAPSALFRTDNAALAQAPELAVIFAARAEDVQMWLEQVEPLNDVAAVAVTSAGADPLLRPYLDSGQLSGLVSGFDGAYAYEELAGFSRSLAAEEQARVRLAAQNWGQLALLLILVLGNLAGLFGRGERD